MRLHLARCSCYSSPDATRTRLFLRMEQPQTALRGNEDPGNSTLVTFNASVEGRNLLRSMSPMNKGIQSRVYVFDSNAGTKGSPEASGLYITSSPGVLTGSDGYKMFLSMALIISTPYPTISPRFPDIHEWRIRTPLQRYRLSLVERHTTGCK